MKIRSYSHYIAQQGNAPRPVFAVGHGGRKLGVLEKDLGDILARNPRVRGEISYVKTTIQQGTWGDPPNGYIGVGKVAGLLCVSQIDTQSGVATVWYQIGVGSNGKPFAELGWKGWWGEGAILKEYNNFSIDKNTVLEMVPKETPGTNKINSVDFSFGDIVKTLTWDQASKDWVPKSSGKPDFDWNNMNEIYWIRLQIEVYWNSFTAAAFGNKIHLPGTEGDPFLIGPIKAEYKTQPGMKLRRRMIRGNEFSPPELHTNDSDFGYQLRDEQRRPLHKIKLWGSGNSAPEGPN